MLDDDALLRSLGRLLAIRTRLASRSGPYLQDLSIGERDLILDDMALREYRAERPLDDPVM